MRPAAPSPRFPEGRAGAIEDYLAELRLVLADRAGGDEAADEVESHLLDLRDELLVQGLEPDAAEREAVERFGSPAIIARGHRSLLLPAGYELGLVAAIGMCTVGIAGLVGIATRAAFGGVASTGDTVSLLVGVVGTVVAEFLWLRRDGRTIRPDSPIRPVATGGLAALGCVLLLAAGSTMIAADPPAPSLWLPLGLAALAAAAVSRRIYRALQPAVTGVTGVTGVSRSRPRP